MTTRTTCRSCGKAIPESLTEHAYCVACRYHNPPSVRPWDDDSRPTPPEPYTLPVSWEEPEDIDDDAAKRVRHQSMRGLIEFLAGKGTPKTTGLYVKVLAALVGVNDYESHAKLAKDLRVTPARISQVFGDIAKDFPSLGRVKHRQRARKI